MITCFLKTKDNTITLSWAKKSSNYLDPRSHRVHPTCSELEMIKLELFSSFSVPHAFACHVLVYFANL